MSKRTLSAPNLFLEQNLRVNLAFKAYEARWLGLYDFIRSLAPQENCVDADLEGLNQADTLKKRFL